MKQPKHIYIVSKVGPEWNEPVSAFFKKTEAELECKSLDAKLGHGGFDEMSHHEVQKIPLNHAQG